MAQKLIVEIVGDSSQYERTLRRTAQQTRKFQANVSGFGRSAAAAGAGFYGVQGLISGLETSVSAASNLSEQMSKSRQLFAGSSREIESWSRQSARNMGLARDQALEAASSFGALLRPLGVTGDEAARQSQKLTQLGADLASFYNTSVTDALAALRSGLVGESEPLRRYGVLLSETRVQQQALADTGKKSAGELTDQEKVLARLEITLKDSAQASGDFARTSEGAANQLRILKANARDLGATLAEDLLPPLTAVMKGLNWIAQHKGPSGLDIGKWFGSHFEGPPGFFGNRLKVPTAGFGGIFTRTAAAFDTGGLGSIFNMFGGPISAAQGIGQGIAGGMANQAIANANKTIDGISDFINKYTEMGRKWEAAQKAAAARRARNQLARERFRQGLETQWGWLEFGLEKAQATKTLADDRRMLRKQEQWLLNRIKHAGRTLELSRQLWRVRDQIRDLNKQKASDGDPLAGLMQVSSKQLASVLAVGTGLGAYGRNILAANIAGQEIHTYVHLDGREVARSVNRSNARSAHRTSRQTSGLR